MVLVRYKDLNRKFKFFEYFPISAKVTVGRIFLYVRKI